MRFVSQAFERVRALLFEPRKSGPHSRHDHPAKARVYAVQPSPGRCAPVPAFTCSCRAGGGPASLDVGHPLARTCVLPPEKRQNILRVDELTGVSR